jgi:hypothetical protein
MLRCMSPEMAHYDVWLHREIGRYPDMTDLARRAVG